MKQNKGLEEITSKPFFSPHERTKAHGSPKEAWEKLFASLRAKPTHGWANQWGKICYVGFKKEKRTGPVSKPKNAVKLFEERQVRAAWDPENEKWWFSILDIIAVLTDQSDYGKTRNYWKWLKNKLKTEGSELVSKTNRLKLVAADGKRYLTDVADTEQVLRLVHLQVRLCLRAPQGETG